MRAFTSRDLMITVLPEREDEPDLISACKAGANCTTSTTNPNPPKPMPKPQPKPQPKPRGEYVELQGQLETILKN